MIDPPLWTREQLDADRTHAIGLFRKARMEEPLEDYLEGFDEYQGYIEGFWRRQSICHGWTARRLRS